MLRKKRSLGLPDACTSKRRTSLIMGIRRAARSVITRCDMGQGVTMALEIIRKLAGRGSWKRLPSPTKAKCASRELLSGLIEPLLRLVMLSGKMIVNMALLRRGRVLEMLCAARPVTIGTLLKRCLMLVLLHQLLLNRRRLIPLYLLGPR